MVEKSIGLKICTHLCLVIGIIILLLPIYFAWVASTHSVKDLLVAPIPLTPGHQFLHNYYTVLTQGSEGGGSDPVIFMLRNSLIMALGIALGKIIISMISAYAIVYFAFPFRKLFFWLIFSTLMLPVQVRIVPTFQVVASLNLLNTYSGLILPLIASATATFLFRQFFMTIPTELIDAAKMDGAGPMRFFVDVLLPLSKTNIAALFVIMFIYGWNQYLWPLVATTSDQMNTIVMGMQKLTLAVDQIPEWNLIMATAILALLPPVLVMLIMQRWFVKGLLEVEK
ncbi:MAG: glycerol-3-phosphate transporter [Gammaproteobacteria bacterium RIFCSPHIGHO2_12_FULL_35_23]|nr:MAG: glycerol-3-phosphate transporter [Gammaproteobacteria bacterium RIFCSPHIGHO2_12_FULL_35_23]